MNYQEAIEAVKQNPEKSYIGIIIRSGNHKGDWIFGTYTISINADEDPDYISIYFEGGLIFDELYGGEEEAYCLESVPDEAKSLYYKSTEGMPEISGNISEYALYQLFPDLEDPDDIWEEKGRFDFINQARHMVANDWRGVGTQEAICKLNRLSLF